MKNKKLMKVGKILFIISIILIVLSLVWVIFFEKDFIFRNQESLFMKAGKKYYTINQRFLPNKGEVRSVSLQKVYDKNLIINALTIPKSDKLCDVDDSWVKVYGNDDGSYSYYVYLKCGNYESKTDHKGPIITLKGETEVISGLDIKYTDLGVSSVVDDIDGKLNVKDVVIDTSKVKIDEVGTYDVIFRAYDKLRNMTKITRKVTIIEKLSERVIKDTNNLNYYVGKEPNNLVIFSGMLWQIVGLNDDGSVKLVLFDNIANLSYGKDSTNFDDSNIKNWLNNVFYPSLTNKDKYVKKDSKWCIENIDNYQSLGISCANYGEASPVGMISMYEYKRAMDSEGYNYLFSRNTYRFINKTSNGKSWIVYPNDYSVYYPYDDNKLVGVRPVINLNDSLYIVSGNGSNTSPYKLNDYKYGKENSKLSDRLTGEYISYSGYLWRKVGVDNDGNTKLVMADIISKVGTSEYLKAGYKLSDKEKIFNPTEEGNLGYVINEEIINYLDSKYLVNHSWELPSYKADVNYDKFDKNTFKARISIPTSYDLFSGSNGNDDLRNTAYWLLDTVKDSPFSLMVNQSNGIAFEVDQSFFDQNGLKLVVYIKKDIKISNGKGTVDSPYYVK